MKVFWSRKAKPRFETCECMTLRLLKWQFCQILSVFSSHAAFGALSKNYCIYDLWIPAAILVMDPLEFVAEEEKRRF